MHEPTERVDLQVGALVASFLPSCGMLGVSLRRDDREFVALPRSLADFGAGHPTGVPLLYPWANRLRSHTYRVGARSVDLHDLGVATDANGLPIHGVHLDRAFAIVELDDARVVTSHDAAAEPDLLAAYPFPHVLTVECTLDADTLTVHTTVDNTGDTALPIAFGWHPFFTLPGTPREQWRLRTPPCEHHVCDHRLLPTGATTPQPALDAPIGTRTYDDHYRLGTDRTFVIADDRHTITLQCGEHYPSAQIYLPSDGDFVCIEPMTGPVAALSDGTTPMVAPGERFTATWSVTVRRT